MQKIYLSFFTFFGVLTAHAQLTQANHAPAAGDTYSMYQCDTVSPGVSGANAMWNFASITTHSSIVSNHTAQAASSSTYASANVVVAASLNNTSYYKSTASDLYYYGGNISVGSGSSAVVAILNSYSSAPAVFASYPMSLATTSISNFGGALDLTSPVQASGGFFHGFSKVLADGSGTLILPGTNATFTNVIRVVTSQTINFNTTLSHGTILQNNYEFYQVGTKNPLFSILTATSTTGLGINTQTFVTRNKNASSAPTSSTTGFSENTVDNSFFTVFPNPSATFVNFVTNHTGAANVSIYDITGKLVEKQVLYDGKLKVEVSSYNKGLYLYIVQSGEGKTLKSGKITVSQ